MCRHPTANKQADPSDLFPCYSHPSKPPEHRWLMTAHLTAPAERCRDGWAWEGCQGSSANLGEEVSDREQTPIRNLVADRDQMDLVGEAEE